MTYDYRVVGTQYGDNKHELEQILYRLGRRGWHVVAAWDGAVILEREIPEKMYAIHEPGAKPVPMFDPAHIPGEPEYDPDA